MQFVELYFKAIAMEYILSFLDAIVASIAAEVVRTKGSTFSGFIENVLWTSTSNSAGDTCTEITFQMSIRR